MVRCFAGSDSGFLFGVPHSCSAHQATVHALAPLSHSLVVRLQKCAFPRPDELVSSCQR